MKKTFPILDLSAFTGLLFLLAIVSPVKAEEVSGNSSNAAPKLTRTVGLDIIKTTTNSDKSLNLTFQWKEKDQPRERTVVVNDNTLIVSDGKILKLADLTEAQLHKKAVATVGADTVTTVFLRFGRAPAPKGQLTPAQQAMLASLVPPATAKSEAALESRVKGIVESLQLKDAAKEARIHAVLAENLRAVRDAHNALLPLDKSVHEKLIAGLQADLTPDQIETAKDKLTINKVPVTFKAYHAIVPDLTPEDDQKILAWLKQAREKSLDVKNPDEMAPIFKEYKKEIEHYLNTHGHDWAKSYKAFADAQKKSGDAAANPAGN